MMVKSSVVPLVLAVLSVQLGCGTPQSPIHEGLKLLGLGPMIDAAFSGYKYCPPPYHHVLGECFYVHQYIPQLTWQEAQDFCKQAGGIGAEPKYFGAVIAQLFNMGKAKEIFNGELINIWLGGHREGNTTTFKWSSSGRIVDEVLEEEHAPAYFTEIGVGDCLMMVLSRQGGPSALRAMDCEARVHYACQLP